VPFNIHVAYAAGGGTPHGRYAIGLWTVVVMPDNVLVPPLSHPLDPYVQLIVQWRKETDIKINDA
jgi:hypothetical protein